MDSVSHDEFFSDKLLQEKKRFYIHLLSEKYLNITYIV